MELTAEYIREQCTTTVELDLQIKLILQTFKSEILEASKNGLTHVIVPVPVNFRSIDSDNATTQTIIYCRLIEHMEEKGFAVIVDWDDSHISFEIRWDLKKEDRNLARMRNVIKERKAKPVRKKAPSIHIA
jgi:hypothetical protein